MAKLLPLLAGLVACVCAPLLRAQTTLPQVLASPPALSRTTADLSPVSIDLSTIFAVPGVTGPIARFDTTSGAFDVELQPSAAPNHAANFSAYATAQAYDNTFFHRVAYFESGQGPSILQGGGYQAVLPGAPAVPKLSPVALEYSLPNARGTLAAARTADPDSATSEWYFNTRDNSTILGPANDGHGYTVFGRVLGTGMTVVDTLAAFPLYNLGSPFTSTPLRDVTAGQTQLLVENFVVLRSVRLIPAYPAANDASALLRFTATSGNPAVASASISSGHTLVVTPLAAGATTITLTTADVRDNLATASFAVTITRQNQTIDFAPPSPQPYPGAPFPLSATASSGLPVGFVLISGPATLSGGVLTFTGTGLVTVEARQAGDATYNAATAVQRSFLAYPAGYTPTTAISAGLRHSLFLRADGTAWASGLNDLGQLGDGTTVTRFGPVPVLSGVQTFSAGGAHSLFVKTDGTVWACGNNGAGQLGDGTTTNRSTPVQVQGLSDVKAVSASGVYPWGPSPNGWSLFLKTDGTVWASGYNGDGQFGDGSKTSRTTPVQVLADVAAISTGVTHSLFLKTDGSAWASGYNYYGQLGDGTTTNRASPVQVMTGVVAIAAGYSHSLFLKADGSVWVTGSNDNGQLGDGTDTNSKRSTPVQIMTGVSAIAASYSHSLFLKTDGSAWGAGRNDYGQLGSASSSTPPFNFSPVKILDGVNALAAGFMQSLFLKPDGFAWATGNNNVGAAGYGAYSLSRTPILLLNATPNQTITFGFPTDDTYPYQASLALGATSDVGLPVSYTVLSGPATVSGSVLNVSAPGSVTVRAFQNGSLNYFPAAPVDRTFTFLKLSQSIAFNPPSSLPPTSGPILLFASATSGLEVGLTVASGPAYLEGNTLHVTGSGSVVLRATQPGDTYYEAAAAVERTLVVGDPARTAQTITFAELPDRVFGDAAFPLDATASSGLPVSVVVLSGPATYADGLLTLTGAGTVSLRATQAGDATYDTAPPAERTFTVFASGLKAASAGYRHSLFLKTDGTAWAVGDNSKGQLGDGSTTSRTAPVRVLANVRALSAGVSHSLFIKTDGTAWAVGGNSDGELGDGTQTSRTTPVQILSGVRAVATSCSPYPAGSQQLTHASSLFLKTDGTVWSTGYNQYGQLGDGGGASRSTPFQIMSGVVAIAAGASHSLFLKADGSVWAAGRNTYGQLADGSATDRYALVKLPITGVKAIAASASRSYFLKTDGTVLVAGENYSTSTNAYLPVLILTDVSDLSAGTLHALFVKTDGTAWAAGYNGDGQLGDNSLTTRLIPPVQILSGIQRVFAGASHSFFLGTDGVLRATGNNAYGQLGDGSVVSRETPVPINGRSQTIAFTSPVDGAQPYVPSLALSAISDSGLPVSFVVVSGPATVSGNSLTLQGLGAVTVRAVQDGDFSYFAAAPVERTFTFTASPQAIAFTPPASLAAGASISLSAEADSGLPVTLTVVSGPAYLDGTTLHATATGTVLLRATQPGNAFYAAAPAVEAILSVTESGKPPQTITFDPPADRTFGDAPFALSASASSGLPVSFVVLSGPATYADGLLTLTGAGTVGLRAIQAGDASYAPAMPVERSFSVAKAPQTIAFPQPVGRAFGDAPFALSATAGSGLPVGFSVVSGPAALDGNLLTLTDVGTVTVRATQPGDADHLPASPVERSFTVAKASQTIAFAPIPAHGPGDAPFAVTATATSGLPVTLQVLSGPATYAGGLLTLTDAGIVVLQATQAGDAHFNAAPPVQSVFRSGTAGPATVKDVSAGYTHSLLLHTDGTAWAAGFNGYNGQHYNLNQQWIRGTILVDQGPIDPTDSFSGQLGDGTTLIKLRPVQVLDHVAALSAGDAHSLFLKTDGTAWATGHNSAGQLGDGTTSSRSTPVQVLTGVRALAASRRALQVTTTDLHTPPVDYPFSYYDDYVVSTRAWSLFLKTDGSAWATGYNGDGQLGDGSTTSRSTPVQVLTGVLALSAGVNHSLFLKTDGSVWATGRNDFGQLGDGSTANRSTPVQVLTGVQAISAGANYSLFLKTDGSVWAVGYNADGQLGDGSVTNRSTPVQVLTGVQALSAGVNHSLFLKTDGTAWAAGRNDYGQLGDGSTTSRQTPVQVLHDVLALSAGAEHSLFLGSDGLVRVCGRNQYGQLGDGTVATRLLPTLIGGQAQTIDFVSPVAGTYVYTPTLTLNATSSSGLPVSYAVVSGPASVSGNVLSLISPGAITVRATQTGNSTYLPATPVERTILVTQAPQAIDLASPAGQVFGHEPITLQATASSGLPVVFTLVSGPATLDGNVLTLTGIGTVAIRATQPGNANYSAATPVETSFPVVPAPATLFLPATSLVYNGLAQPAVAVTSPSGLHVTYAYKLGKAAPTPDAPVNAGTYVVTATLSDPRSSSTASVTGTLVITKAPLTATGPGLTRLVGEPNPTLSITYTGFVNGETEAVLDQKPVASTKATRTSPAGTYPVTLARGADANYALTLVPGSIAIQGFGGSYEAFLFDPASLESDLPRICGKLELTVSANSLGYTGVLQLASEAAPRALKGTLSAETGASATGAWFRAASPGAGLPALDLAFTLAGSGLEARVLRSDTLHALSRDGEGTRLYVLAAPATSSPWTGVRTLVLRDPMALSDADTRALPLGAGHASATIAASGTLKLKGSLSDGLPLTGSVRPDPEGFYRLYVRPYGTRLDSFLAGHLSAGSDDSQAGLLLWQKAALPGTPKTPDKACRAGFACEVDALLDGWLPPAAAKKATSLTPAQPAITLPQRLGLAADNLSSASLGVAYEATDEQLGDRATMLPVALSLSRTGTVAVTAPLTTPLNATKWKMSVVASTGAFTGSFVLSDQVSPPPAKPVSRTVSFSGTLRQLPAPESDASVGYGYFLLPPLPGAASTGQASFELRLFVP